MTVFDECVEHWDEGLLNVFQTDHVRKSHQIGGHGSSDHRLLVLDETAEQSSQMLLIFRRNLWVADGKKPRSRAFRREPNVAGEFFDERNELSLQKAGFQIGSDFHEGFHGPFSDNGFVGDAKLLEETEYAGDVFWSADEGHEGVQLFC